MAVRVYLVDSTEAKDAILWLEDRNLRYKIMRGEKAVDPLVRVNSPYTWQLQVSFRHAYFGIESLTEDDKETFYPKYRDLLIEESDSEHRRGDYSVGFVIYDEKEAIEFKLIYG